MRLVHRFLVGLTAGVALLAASALADEPLVIRQVAQVDLPGAPGDGPADPPPGAAGPNDPGLAFDDEALLDETVQNLQVFEDFLAAQVQKAVNDARSIMGTNPDAAVDLLKQAQQAVRNAPDINPQIRFELNQQLETALRASARSAQIQETREVEAVARQQEAAEQLRLLDELFDDQQRLDSVMKRFEVLMDEGQYRQAEVLIRLARDLEPANPNLVSGVTTTALARAVGELNVIREERNRQYVNTMLNVERSDIPFPDDQPIVYPDPETWVRLTESRRKYASVDLSDEGEAERRIRAALDQTTELEFLDAPLADVRDYLADRHNIDIVFDKDALDAEGITPDTPVSLQLSGITLRSALRIMLKQLGLTYVIQNEVLNITTIAEAETILIPKVYPVADLVIPIESGTGQGLGLTGALMGGGNSGFGGGANGAFGGGGGGLGGGGGGGLGGFGGGGLGGAGGGGFFNVPNGPAPGGVGLGAGGGNFGGGNGGGQAAREAAASRELIEIIQAVIQPDAWDGNGGPGAIRYHAPTKSLVITTTSDVHGRIGGLRNQLQGFDVAEDQALRIEANQSIELKQAAGDAPAGKSPKNTAQQKAGRSAEAGEQDKAPAIDAGVKNAIEQGADPQTVWETLFTARQEDPAVVRATVRFLHKKQQHKHVVGLIQAALRHGQGQPWMYEALGLALEGLRIQGEDIDRTDIERALLSALDVQELNAESVMYLAKYMAGAGFEQRSLKLYRQAALLEPTRPEPYLNALHLAQRHFDLQALQWTTVGVLGQAWSGGNNTKWWQEAKAVGQNAVDVLRATRQFKKADQLQQALAEAQKRDLIVTISWTGDADMDLAVEEPAGTICHRRNPRTSSGGVLLEDCFSSGQRSSKLLSETYICSQAFNGPYRVILKRSWGKPTAGKVTVDVYTNWGEPLKMRHHRQQVSIGDTDAAVLLTIDEGRRAEPLEDRLVANAVEDHVALRRELLLKQLDAISDKYAQRQWAGGRQRAALGERIARVAGPNAPVGFQPVITTLSSGIQYTAQGVISADRRYVRFAGTPFFSNIPEVTIFNIGSGESRTVPGPGGGAVLPGDVIGGGGGDGGADDDDPIADGGGGVGGTSCPLNSLATTIPIATDDLVVTTGGTNIPVGLGGVPGSSNLIIVGCNPVAEIRFPLTVTPRGQAPRGGGITTPTAINPPGYYLIQGAATVNVTDPFGSTIDIPSGTLIFVAP